MEGKSSLAHEGSEVSQYHDSQEEVPQLASEDSSWPLVGGDPVHRAHIKRKMRHQRLHMVSVTPCMHVQMMRTPQIVSSCSCS